MSQFATPSSVNWQMKYHGGADDDLATLVVNDVFLQQQTTLHLHRRSHSEAAGNPLHRRALLHAVTFLHNSRLLYRHVRHRLYPVHT